MAPSGKSEIVAALKEQVVALWSQLKAMKGVCEDRALAVDKV